MRISFLVNEVAGGWEPTDARLGGTEESVVRWAEELAQRGHEVFVFRNGRIANLKEHNFVTYFPRESYAPGDVCINVKSSEIAPREPTLYFTNEMNASQLDLSAYSAVVWPSQWAKEHISVNNPRVLVVPHGYDVRAIYPGQKIRKQCFYASSPDRGLDVLLEAWPQVIAAHPDATLILTYGVKGVHMPGVMSLGNVDEDTMDDIYRTSEFWCHPCTGIELFCITGIKAQAAGCWPVIIPAMALKETVRYGTFSDREHYAADLIEALKRRPQAPVYDYPSWKDSTDALEQAIKQVYSGR